MFLNLVFIKPVFGSVIRIDSCQSARLQGPYNFTYCRNQTQQTAPTRVVSLMYTKRIDTFSQDAADLMLEAAYFKRRNKD